MSGAETPGAVTRFDAVRHAIGPAAHDSSALLVEIFLWLGGLLCLLWVGGSRLEALTYQHRAGARLVGSAAGPAADPAPGAAGAEGVSPGEPVARLVVPSLGLEAVVAEGAADDVLAVAVGRLRASAAVGSDGNVVLAAHRDSFFRRLGSIRPGEEILLEGAERQSRYLVEWTRVVTPRDTWVTADAGYPALTLVTCYPFRFVGSAPDRFVVRARRVGPAAAPSARGR